MSSQEIVTACMLCFALGAGLMAMMVRGLLLAMWKESVRLRNHQQKLRDMLNDRRVNTLKYALESRMEDDR